MFTGIRIDYLEEGLDCSFDLELRQNLTQPL